MKILKRIFLGLLILIVVAASAAFFLGRNIARRALPDYNKDILMTALDGEVTVIRDQYAMPHIYATTQRDLYMAVGYISAQDRMWQMDLLRRATQGRLSEIFGADLVDVDHRMRSLRISEKSERIFAGLDTEVRTCMEAYADGVNRYLSDQGKALPPEFGILQYKPEAWEPVHSLNLIGYMSWDLSMAWSTEIVLYKISQLVDSIRFAEMIPDLGIQSPPIFPNFHLDSLYLAAAESLPAHMKKLSELGLQVFNASNNWAVAPSRTGNGKALFSNDMHLGLFAPGLWYQMHQVVGDELNVTGLLLPGQPLIIAGHNQDIAWGMTNVMLDDIDFYLETTSEDHPGQYLFEGEWRDFTKVTETIMIKGGEEVQRDILYTHRGPVITEFKQTGEDVISMHWIGNDESNELQTVYELNRASNWPEFEQACSHFVSIAQNINYADTRGNIGLHTAGGVPMRPGVRAFISPGDTGLYDWQGFVPFDSLPHTYNPASGQVSSANNRTAGTDYPYEISHWYDLPYRIKRIREMLDSKETLSIQDFILMQGDQESVLARQLNPAFVKALQSADSITATERQALEMLASWDNTFRKDEAAPLVFEALYRHLLDEIFLDELGPDMMKEFLRQDLLASYVIDRILSGQTSAWCDDISTQDKTEDFDDMVRRAFPKAVDWLVQHTGKNAEEWNWGSLHTLTLAHPLGAVKAIDVIFKMNRGPYPVGGSYHTVSPFSFSMNEPFAANHGASHRHIYIPGDWDKSLSVIPTGISGIPASPHYCDQTRLYLDMQYHADPFSREAVEAAGKYRMSFRLGGD